MQEKKHTLDIVVPVYNEEDCFDELLERLEGLRNSLPALDVRYIFVNDGSRDQSAAMLDACAERHAHATVIHLSRNFGHQIAVTAGLDHADADYVAIIDADLQDPPERIADMYRKAQEGYDVVYGQRRKRDGETAFKRATANLFYRLMDRMCNVEIPRNTGDFRLISRPVHQALGTMKEKHIFLRGMVPWVGFRSAPLVYDRDKRYAGESKYPLRKMIRFAKDAVFSFSDRPLRVANLVGYVTVFLGVLGGILMLYFRLFTDLSVPGITAVILTIVIIGGIQIIILGIIGEYIGRIFDESKNRPLYFVQRTKNIIKE